MRGFRQRRERALLVLLLALATGAGLRLYLMGRCSPFGSDSFHYMELARGLVEEGRYVSRGSQHPDLSRYPLFPSLIAVGAALGLSFESAGKAVSFLASLFIVFPLWFLARSAFGRSAALPAAVVGAVSCASAGTQRIGPDALATLLYLSAAAALWATIRTRRILPALACGLSAGLAVVARPEGAAWCIVALSAVLFLAFTSRPTRGDWKGAVLGVAVVAIPICSLYVGWISARLHRFCVSPGVEYIRSVRETGDHYGARNFNLDGIRWEERATNLLNADRTDFVLAVRFATRTFPAADPRWTSRTDPSFERDGTARSDDPVRWADRMGNLRLRIFILRQNLVALPGKLRSAHFLPPVPVALGGIGAISTLRSRKRRHGSLFLLACGLLTILPLLSHIEDRFLLPGVAFTCVFAGRGWAVVDFELRRFASRLRWLRPAIHLALLAGIVGSTIAHASVCSRPVQQEELYRKAGESLAREPGGGPVLAVHPHVTWFADRPYRRLPLGGPDATRDYGRFVGASAVVLNLPYDRERRPDLGPLLDLPPPAGFRVFARVENGDGREIRILEFEQGEPR